MASLVGIPPELLEPICAELANGDILNLCKSSKGLYSAAHPRLFRHVTIAWDASVPDTIPNVNSLLQFILRNPSYAKYVKAVDILDFRPIARLCNSCGNPWRWDPEDNALVRAVIEDCCLPHANEWYTDVVEKGDPGAIIVLFLAQCTHLESLTVDIDLILPGKTWLPDVIRAALSAPEAASRLSRFHKLTHITVPKLDNPGREKDLYLASEALLLFFYLPSVTTLCYKQPWGPTPRRSQWPHSIAWPLAHPPLAASLTTLRLDFTLAPADSLESLLRQTPNLQSLVYDCKLPSTFGVLDLEALRQGLDHVRDTLTHLVVRFYIFADEALDPESLNYVTWSSLGSLGSLTALEDLEISLGVLFGQVSPDSAPPLAHVLPRGLKRLVINDELWDYNAFEDWVGEPIGALLKTFFAGAWRTATPALEEFVLDMRRNGFMAYEYWDEEGNTEKLRQLVESQGIRCLIHPDEG